MLELIYKEHIKSTLRLRESFLVTIENHGRWSIISSDTMIVNYDFHTASIIYLTIKWRFIARYSFVLWLDIDKYHRAFRMDCSLQSLVVGTYCMYKHVSVTQFVAVNLAKKSFSIIFDRWKTYNQCLYKFYCKTFGNTSINQFVPSSVQDADICQYIFVKV